MTSQRQIDCFRYAMTFWNYLGVSPYIRNPYYNVYSKIFTTLFVFFYNFLSTVNLFFIPKIMDLFIEEMIFYFTTNTVIFKVLTFYSMRGKIVNNVTYWIIVTTVSLTSHLTHISSPLIMELLSPLKLELPTCGYFFLSESFKEEYIHTLYLYQAAGMHCHLWFIVNTDTFVLGLLILTIAQLEILDVKLRKVTDRLGKFNEDDNTTKESEAISRLNKCFIHYEEVSKFCDLIVEVFSVSLFIQYGTASCIICICLFRFTLPAPWQYYIFLTTYMFIMVILILIPCWFGTRVIEKSCLLSRAAYSSNWTPQSRRFKSSLRIFVEKANQPITIIAGKMIPLSLTTFTSIMNSAYSFFALLRHMQTRNG